MNDLTKLRCFNPSTGKHDGGYCVWEGKGKCMKCEAADEIERLQKAYRPADMIEYQELVAENERLEAVVDAARHLLAGGDKEAVYHLEKALAALEAGDE
jgi:hypothetical protein